MATDSRMAMIGMIMKALPRLPAMSPKVTSSGGSVPFSTLCFGIEKGGRAGVGMPPFMSPVSVKVQSSLENIFLQSQSKPCSHLLFLHTWMSGVINIATIAMVTTTRAFLGRDIKEHFLNIFRLPSCAYEPYNLSDDSQCPRTHPSNVRS